MHMFFYIYNIIHVLFDGNFTLQHIINNIILSTKSPLPKRTSQIAIKRLYNITWVRGCFLNSNPHTILFNNIVFLHTHIIFHVHCYYTFSSCNAGWVFFQISIMFRLGPRVFRLIFARCFFDSKLFKNWVAMECRLKHTVNYINLTK